MHGQQQKASQICSIPLYQTMQGIIATKTNFSQSLKKFSDFQIWENYYQSNFWDILRNEEYDQPGIYALQAIIDLQYKLDITNEYQNFQLQILLQKIICQELAPHLSGINCCVRMGIR